MKTLERDLAAQRSLLGRIDLGHRPAAQPAQQPIIAQLPARKIEIEPVAAAVGVPMVGVSPVVCAWLIGFI